MFRVVIESIDSEGRGVTRVNGKVTFVEKAITGETAVISLVKKKPSYNLATISSLASISSSRVNPKCSSYGVCGGCSFQHVSQATQVACKQRTLEENLQRIGKVFPDIIFPSINGFGWKYRNKARFSARYVRKREEVLVGFREKGKSYVVDMTACEVVPQEASYLLKPLRVLIQSLSLYELVPQIELAVGESIIGIIVRVMGRLTDEDKIKFEIFGKLYSLKIFIQPEGPDNVYLLYPKDCTEELSYSLPEFRLKYDFRPDQFTQVNFDINRILVRRAISLLAPQNGDRIADFFCGLGNFSLAIASRGAHVTGYEGSGSLVKKAKQNAYINNLSETTNFEVLDLFGSQTSNIKGWDKWLLDPPRDGALTLIKGIGHDGPTRIVYVSCNSSTLARDAGYLVREKGYLFSGCGLVNMFPQTTHFECIAVFDKETT